MKFPVFSQLAGNWGDLETGSLVTPSSSGESIANLTPSIRLRLQEMEFATAVGPFTDLGG